MLSIMLIKASTNERKHVIHNYRSHDESRDHILRGPDDQWATLWNAHYTRARVAIEGDLYDCIGSVCVSLNNTTCEADMIVFIWSRDSSYYAVVSHESIYTKYTIQLREVIWCSQYMDQSIYSKVGQGRAEYSYGEQMVFCRWQLYIPIHTGFTCNKPLNGINSNHWTIYSCIVLYDH